MNSFRATALCPLDGRYAEKMTDLRALCSEYGLNRFRLQVEVEWLCHLLAVPALFPEPPLSEKQMQQIRSLYENFSTNDHDAIKRHESHTRHDVKAVEYWLTDCLRSFSETDPAFTPLLPWVHFACTSEDINNLAYACMLRESREQVLLPILRQLHDTLSLKAKQEADLAMLSRTHGQPASPTTLGKEWANMAYRLSSHLQYWETIPLTGKINGAVGNANAHRIAEPAADWPLILQGFVEKLGFRYHPYTTQIEPHDTMAQYAHALVRLHTVLIDISRDIWGYIAWGYLGQKTAADEVGSSVMPHKVNPIDFENAEGNLGLANALLQHFAEKLPISRWQRDLSDSTVQRNWGMALGYGLLAYSNLLTGLSKIQPHAAAIRQDLDQHCEVLAEAIQTVMRRHGLPQAYEQLKSLTRGQSVDLSSLREFVRTLAIPETSKQRLLALTPDQYTGYAAQWARAYPAACALENSQPVHKK